MEKTTENLKDKKKNEPRRKPYVKPRVKDGEPLRDITMITGGGQPPTQTPFIIGDGG